MVEIRRFEPTDLLNLTQLIHYTIEKCYPTIYNPEVVDFFISYHSEIEILRRAGEGQVYLLFDEGIFIATGFLHGNEIGGVYVSPNRQGKGYGRLLMEYLLTKASENALDKIWLDATLLAKPLYDRLGFETIENACQMVGEARLDYFRMEKNLMMPVKD